MKGITLTVLLGVAAVLAIALAITHSGAAQQGQPARTGMLIGIKPDKISAYEALHAASNPGVRDLLDKYHMHNFSIFIHKMDDSHYYLFAYYEYTGNDPAGDKARMAAEPRNQKWLSTTDSLQIPLDGEKSWSKMQEIYHNP